MADQPATYDVATLLNSGVQPLPDLDDDEMDALAKSLGRKPLDDPISISSDGVLLDGHQRLKAVLRNGRKRLNASEVHVIKGANKGNALEWAVQLNVQRRHLTTEDKADLARRLQRQRHWSQTKIARLFGVTQPAVSQWLARDEDYEPPSYVIGDDDRAYSYGAPARRSEKDPTNPWRTDGAAYRALAKARRVLQRDPLGDLSPIQLARVAELLGDVIEGATALQEEVAARS